MADKLRVCSSRDALKIVLERHRGKLTQKTLADASTVGAPSLSEFLGGKSIYSDRLDKLVAALPLQLRREFVEEYVKIELPEGVRSAGKVLWLDDQPLAIEPVAKRLSRFCSVVCIETKEKAEQHLKTDPFICLIIIDIKLEGAEDGIQFARQVKREYGVDIVIYSAFGREPERWRQGCDVGVKDWLSKDTAGTEALIRLVSQVFAGGLDAEAGERSLPSRAFNGEIQSSEL